ncbi:hypothetical protein HYC85_005861 [Camellia sinensis]|uniref:Uncharacterized protein n=1 Tax=Camellia sinensis TaxID=4442 RepID=A0A7J7I2F0_CAMSI|nr:hypothetical protein HYC85_005861 [Camellia sinensis]
MCQPVIEGYIKKNRCITCMENGIPDMAHELSKTLLYHPGPSKGPQSISIQKKKHLKPHHLFSTRWSITSGC